MATGLFFIQLAVEDLVGLLEVSRCIGEEELLASRQTGYLSLGLSPVTGKSWP